MIIGIDASRAYYHQRTGTENYTYQLIHQLADKKLEKQITLYTKEGLSEREYQSLSKSDNIKVKKIALPRLWTQIGLSTEILKRPPDVLFVPAHTIPIMRRPGQKTVVTIHDLGAKYLEAYHKLPQRLYLNKTTEYIARHASHIIAVSQSTKSDLMAQLNVPGNRITVVYEGYNKKQFKPIAENQIEQSHKKYKIKTPYFLYVGTIQPRKNLARLIKAYAKYYHSTKSTDNTKVAHFYLAGKSGWLNDEIFKAPQTYDVKEAVQFLDYIDEEDLPSLYAGATALLYPSLYEGFGLPIIESMACGTPVLTSNRSSTKEIGANAAYLVDPENIEQITIGIKRLAQEQELRQKLIQLGLEHVKHFSWEKCASETLAVLLKTAKG